MISWAHSLSWQDDNTAILCCRSEVGTVNFKLHTHDDSFSWGVLGKPDGLTIKRITKAYGRTDLMGPIIEGIHAYLTAMAKAGTHDRISIFGYDPKRANMYKQWATNWKLPNYRGMATRSGVTFVREGSCMRRWMTICETEDDMSREHWRRFYQELEGTEGNWAPYIVRKHDTPDGVSYGVYQQGHQIASAKLSTTGRHVFDLAVQPEHRGRKIATALYHHIENDLGHRLEPSPTYQTDAGKGFWKSRPRRLVARQAEWSYHPPHAHR